MSAPTTPVRQSFNAARHSPEAALKIFHSPYVNFRSGVSPELSRVPIKSPLQSQPPPKPSEAIHPSGSHAHPQTPPPSSWKKLNPSGHGSRHIYDDFPFSLWVEAEHDYRPITREEVHIISQTYQAKTLFFIRSFVIVVVSSPPTRIPLTIACAPAYFISPETHKRGWVPCAPFGNSEYGYPRIKNPFPECETRRWEHPPPSDVEIIANRLLELCNVKTLVFNYPTLTVVLRNDGRTYEKHSLPARVGYWATTYYHGEGDLWKQWPLAAELRNREMTPNIGAGIQDTTDYRTSFLRPGVRLSGLTKSTSCGVQVKNRNNSSVRITCANHGFMDSNNVYHPDTTQRPIGEIKERYEDEDVALIELGANVPFKNDSYFAAETPKRFLTGAELEKLNGTWFEADGMSTGLVAFFNATVIYEIPPRRPEDYHKIPYGLFQLQMVFNAIGTVGTQQLADGICGAPLVQCLEDIDRNTGTLAGVAGFFQIYYEGGFVATPILDKLIKDGWEVHG